MPDLIVQSSPDINVTVTGPNAVAVSVVTGQPGADGRSAYQIAVDNGFVGTQTQWLASLKGEPGQQGDPGQNGSNGLAGDIGPSGLSAYEIAVEHGFSGTQAQWLASLKGDPGEPGPNEIDVTTQTTFQGLLAGNGGDVYVPTPAEARGIIKIQRRLEFTFDGGGSPLADDDATPVNAVDFVGSIVSWILLETDGTGVAVDVWRVAAGNIPTALDSIVDGDYPTGNGQASGNVSAWSETALAVGDVLVASLQTSGGATFVKLVLICEEG